MISQPVALATVGVYIPGARLVRFVPVPALEGCQVTVNGEPDPVIFKVIVPLFAPKQVMSVLVEVAAMLELLTVKEGPTPVHPIASVTVGIYVPATRF